MMKKGMHFFIPPIFDPTSPLLGPLQLAGYADNIGYNFYLQDLNIKFSKYIIDSNFMSYNNLIKNLKSCKTTEEYWTLMNYAQSCYDSYSNNFIDLHFKLNGLETTKYYWNIWDDIERFVNDYVNTDLGRLFETWILEYDFKDYNIVGINITFESQLFIAMLLCAIIKKLKPNSFIIIGGGWINTYVISEDYISSISKYCDMVFIGHGETLIQYLVSNMDYNQLLSLGKFVKSSDIFYDNILMHPPRIPNGEINYLSPYKVLPLRMMSSCYWGKCNFCCEQAEICQLSKSHYNFKDIIQFCIKHWKRDFDCIYFTDSAIPIKYLKTFSEQLLNNGIKFNWATNARLDKEFDNEQLIELLAKSGCTLLKFGLESGSQKIIDMMDKGIDVNKAAKIINLCHKYNIFVHLFVMFGFPGETDNDRKMTRNFLLNEYSHPDSYDSSEFTMYRNTPIAQKYHYNFDIKGNKDGWHYAEYNFVTNKIRSEITNIRRIFDKKYGNKMLFSSGHTIALKKLFQ